MTNAFNKSKHHNILTKIFFIETPVIFNQMQSGGSVIPDNITWHTSQSRDKSRKIDFLDLMSYLCILPKIDQQDSNYNKHGLDIET